MILLRTINLPHRTVYFIKKMSKNAQTTITRRQGKTFLCLDIGPGTFLYQIQSFLQVCF